MGVDGTGRSVPLILDLDGSVIMTDCLFESFGRLLKRKPIHAVILLVSMALGLRIWGKWKFAEQVTLDPATLPYNEDVVEFARKESVQGRKVYIATATVEPTARDIADHLGFIDGVFASNSTNLKGKAKAELLKSEFPSGFAYLGDSTADKPVWSFADEKLFAGSSDAAYRTFKSVDTREGREFRTQRATCGTIVKQLRVHQWAKNLLIFVPLVSGHAFSDLSPWLVTFIGFVIFSLFASATYTINDLLDLEADRVHKTKRNRPLASGRLKISSAIVLAVVLLVGGLVSAVLLNLMFAALMMVYLVTTLSYSAVLKRVAFLDCVILGGLFTVRIMLGSSLSDIAVTMWLLLFSSLFFFSLSVAKRYSEIQRYSVSFATKEKNLIPGRGYYGSDAPLVLVVGVASSFSSLLVFVLYLVESAFVTSLYNEPDWLWAIVPFILLWMLRIWTFAHRAILDDDPVSFAVKDRVSIVLGALFAAAFVVAKFGI